MRNRIYIIEDRTEDMNQILAKLNEISTEKNTEKTQFEFCPLSGTIGKNCDGEEFQFYDESVIEQIEEKKQSEAQHDDLRICLLLDIYLTGDDWIKKNSDSHSGADLAKKIYLTFKEQMPIYIITDAAWFATQCDVIMGVDLSDQFIPKNALLRYDLEEDIRMLFEFYENEDIINA